MNIKEDNVQEIVDDFHAMTENYITDLEITAWVIRLFLVFALVGIFEFASNMNQ